MKAARIIPTVTLFVFLASPVFADLERFTITERTQHVIDPPFSSLSVEGNFVAWIDRRNWDITDLNDDIYGYNLAEKKEFPICTEVHPQTSLSIGDNFVVWEDQRRKDDIGCEGCDIYAYNLTTQEEFPLVTQGVQHETSMDGDIAVYRTGWGIRGYNFSTGEDFPISAGSGRFSERPSIKGNIVAWESFIYSDEEGFHDYDIWAHNLNTSETFTVCEAPGDQISVSVGENFIFWHDGRDDSSIYGYDLSTEEEFIFSEGGSVPIESEGFIFQGGPWGIRIFNSFTKEEVGTLDINSKFDVDGEFLVWSNLQGIYGAHIPEPATLVLLLAGSLLLRRRK